MKQKLGIITPEEKKEFAKKETVEIPNNFVHKDDTPSIAIMDLDAELNQQDRLLYKNALQEQKIRFEKFKILFAKVKTPQKSELKKTISLTIRRYEKGLDELDKLIQPLSSSNEPSERIKEKIEEKKDELLEINSNIENLFSRIEKEASIYTILENENLSESKKDQELILMAKDSVKDLNVSSEIKKHISERYIILGKLASGGMGIAFDAYDYRLRKSAVAKMIKPIKGHIISKRSLDAFKNEGKSIAKFQHPNIVNIYEMEADNTGAFYGIEKAEKGDFSKEIREGNLDEEKIINMAIDVFKGLVKMHEQKLVHRDLKPSNIFKSDYGYMIGDFGLVKDLNDEQTKILALEEMLKNSLSGKNEEFDNQSYVKILKELKKDKNLQAEFFEHKHQGSVKALELYKELRKLASDISLNDVITLQDSGIKGTPSFASPEQMIGIQTTPKSDIFSMGTVLYVASTGKNPFSNKSLKKVIESLQYKDVKSLEDIKTNFAVSSELSSLVKEMMQKDINSRPDSEEVLAELEKIKSKYNYE